MIARLIKFFTIFAIISSLALFSFTAEACMSSQVHLPIFSSSMETGLCPMADSGIAIALQYLQSIQAVLSVIVVEVFIFFILKKYLLKFFFREDQIFSKLYFFVKSIPRGVESLFYYLKLFIYSGQMTPKIPFLVLS